MQGWELFWKSEEHKQDSRVLMNEEHKQVEYSFFYQEIIPLDWLMEAM